MSTGTQTRAHGKARVKPTFVSESGTIFQAKTITDVSWNPNISTEYVPGAGQLRPVAVVVSEAQPKVSFKLEHDDARGLIAACAPGSGCTLRFTATTPGLDPFDVEIDVPVVVYGQQDLGAMVSMSFEWAALDIKIDNLSIIEREAVG